MKTACYCSSIYKRQVHRIRDGVSGLFAKETSLFQTEDAWLPSVISRISEMVSKLYDTIPYLHVTIIALLTATAVFVSEEQQILDIVLGSGVE